MNPLLQQLHRVDTLVFLWLHACTGRTYRKSIRFLSHTGDGHLYALIGLGLILFEPVHGEIFVVSGLTAYALDVSLYLCLKNGIKRDRPAAKINAYQAWITPSDQFSFPSGHTAAAFLFACLIASTYPAFGIVAYLWACSIGISRVLLGVHYPGDIVAGALLGTICAFVGASTQPWILEFVSTFF